MGCLAAGPTRMPLANLVCVPQRDLPPLARGVCVSVCVCVCTAEETSSGIWFLLDSEQRPKRFSLNTVLGPCYNQVPVLYTPYYTTETRVSHESRVSRLTDESINQSSINQSTQPTTKKRKSFCVRRGRVCVPHVDFGQQFLLDRLLYHAVHASSLALFV